MPDAAWIDEICLAAGLILLAFSVRMYGATRAFLARCINTEGRIVGHTESTDSDSGRISCFDLIQFTDRNGDKHDIGGGHGQQRPSKVGRSVPITYDPSYPANAFITGSGSPWVIPVFVAVLGAVALAVGGIVLISIG